MFYFHFIPISASKLPTTYIFFKLLPIFRKLWIDKMPIWDIGPVLLDLGSLGL